MTKIRQAIAGVMGRAAIRMGWRHHRDLTAKLTAVTIECRNLRGSLRSAVADSNKASNALHTASENIKGLKVMAGQTANVNRYARLEALQEVQEFLDAHHNDDTVRVRDVRLRMNAAYNRSSAYEEAFALRRCSDRVAEFIEDLIVNHCVGSDFYAPNGDDIREAVADALPDRLVEQLDRVAADIAVPVSSVLQDLKLKPGTVIPIKGYPDV